MPALALRDGAGALKIVARFRVEPGRERHLHSRFDVANEACVVDVNLRHQHAELGAAREPSEDVRIALGHGQCFDDGQPRRGLARASWPERHEDEYERLLEPGGPLLLSNQRVSKQPFLDDERKALPFPMRPNTRSLFPSESLCDGTTTDRGRQ
jgi:hypothetical protein